MFHKVPNMASMTTPSRFGRGLAVPGIDTQGPKEKLGTAISYGGCLTPPQSAHESRRGSLAHSALSEGPISIPISSTIYSQPATPQHALDGSSDPFAQHWAIHGSDRSDGEYYSIPASTHLPDEAIHPTFQQPQDYNDGMGHLGAPFDPSLHIHHHDSLHMHIQMTPDQMSRGAWTQSHLSPSLDMQDGGFQSTLFRSSEAMHTAACVANTSYEGTSLAQSNLNTGSGVSIRLGNQSFVQHPQIVVPSQLSPVDHYSLEQYNGYSSPDFNNEGLSTSFASSSTSFSAFDCVTPTSADEAYFPCEQSVDRAMVKPAAISYQPIVRPHSPGSWSSGATTGETPPRRRPAKRSGKADPPSEVVYALGCAVRIKGRDLIDRNYAWEGSGEHLKFVRGSVHASPGKPHKCRVILMNGKECGAPFERSEHLKRHQQKTDHGGERLYKCPLPDCKHEKGCTRGDNAGDHFKTHLKGKKTGRRNQQFEWPFVKRCLLNTYPSAKANKLITNIERWIENKGKNGGEASHQWKFHPNYQG